MDNDHLLGRRLVFAGKALRAHFDAALSAAGASLTTWIVLASAETYPGLSQTELAERIGVEGPTLVRHLDRMSGDGLLERLRDPADRRVARIRLTEAGRRRYRELAKVADTLDTQLRSLFTPDEYAVLERAIDRITAYTEEPHVIAHR